MEGYKKMKKIICALLSLAFMFSLTACGESEADVAAEIKGVISSYETNLENANFSKFTLTSEYSNVCEYNHDLILTHFLKAIRKVNRKQNLLRRYLMS